MTLLTVDRLLEKLQNYKEKVGSGDDLITIRISSLITCTVQDVEFESTTVRLSNYQLSDAIKQEKFDEIDNLLNPKPSVCIW